MTLWVFSVRYPSSSVGTLQKIQKLVQIWIQNTDKSIRVYRKYMILKSTTIGQNREVCVRILQAVLKINNFIYKIIKRELTTTTKQIQTELKCKFRQKKKDKK